MKISTKGRYGLRALVDMAVHLEKEPIPLVTIAKRQQISLNYLEQVFGQLRKAGILKSVKGPNGGYFLAKKAELISVKEILEILEGPFSICEEKKEEEQDVLKNVIQELVWNEIDKRVNAFLEQQTLMQLAEEYKNSDVSQNIMYYI